MFNNLVINNLPTFYSTGAASVENGSTTVTPTDALWYGNIWSDDRFFLPSQPLVPPQRIEAVNEDGTLTLAYPWPGDSATEEPYEIRYVGIIERSTYQTRKTLEELGEVSAYYDVQVDTLADRDAFDARPAGYRVMVSDVGDGRAAIFMKKSSADADWSDPAYISGPEGEKGDKGDPGVTWQGDWSPATEYQENDGVLYNGSSWRAKQTHTNQTPPNLPTTENTYWKLIAAKGTDGAGTGDVVGPAGSTADRIAVFDGTTGKLIKDGGKTLDEIGGVDQLFTEDLTGDFSSGEKAQARENIGAPDVTQQEAEEGTEEGVRSWSPERVHQAIASLNPFGNEFLHVRDQKTSGTDGGSATSGSWQTRVLNTVLANKVSGASLSSNRITLPAGQYLVTGHAVARQVGVHQARIQNITGSATLLLGTTEFASNGNNGSNSSKILGGFEISAISEVELQHRVSSNQATNGYGSAAGFGNAEVYADLIIWRVGDAS